MTRYINPSTRNGGVEQIVVSERPGAPGTKITTGMEDAPYDDVYYVRHNGDWVPAPSGGGGGILGKTVWQSTDYDYTIVTGRGTQLKPSSMVNIGSYSCGPDGAYETAPAGYTFDTGVGALAIPRSGWVQVALHWQIRWPSSAPTLLTATAYGLSFFDPKLTGYYPVSPARAGSDFEGEYSNMPHSTGDAVSPMVWAEADDYLFSALWWNTDDDAPQGGTFPGPIPSLFVTITEFS